MSTAKDHGKVREETPTTYYDEVVRLPGYGDAPNRCRPMKPVGFCEDGHTVLGRSSCGVRYCPDHWRDWLEDAVISMVERMAAYRVAQERKQKRMCHVVASPPQDRRYGVRDLWAERTNAYDALEEAGVRGGAVVTHPYRTNDRGDALYEAASDSGDLDEDVGRWKFLRDLVDGNSDELAQYTEASPHYHTLAAVEDVSGEDAPDEWVVENIRSFDNMHLRDTEAYRDMARTVYYVLTHGAVQDGRSTTTYFGEVHPNAFRPAEELTTAEWDRIQIEAEKAVRERREDQEEGSGPGHGPEECPRDGCEACVIDAYHLPEYLEDDEFLRRVRSHSDGRKRLARLRGMLAWWDTRTDRPPPGALTNERRMLEWLEERGDVLTPDPSQVSLETAVM